MTLNNVAFSKNQRRREEEAKKEQELRQLLHNTIDVMTFDQLQKVAKLLNFRNEFNE
jgi:hypothetical protein